MATQAPDVNEVMQKVNAYEAFQAREGIPVVRASPSRTCGPSRSSRGRARAASAPTSTWTAPAARTTPTSARSRRVRRPNPGRQLFEEMIYVLEGNGSTQVWYDENKKVSFEWKTGSLFAVPLNAMHRHFNGRGDYARAASWP